MVGTDGSENAERAVEKIRDMCERWNHEAVVFHSYEHHMLPKNIPISVPISYGSSYTIPPSEYNRIR
ncbi:MAG: hypothetical protein GF353_20845, partial [Candidatus Lokiarchaeota archaeon]|nr:hypothetical protein [Candidatus Lokiarchaeota archaeon]